MIFHFFTAPIKKEAPLRMRRHKTQRVSWGN